MSRYWQSAVLFLTVLVVATSPALAVARDRPSDPAPSPNRLAAAAGGTTFKFDPDAHRVTLRVDSGGDLDQYLFGDASPLDFEMDGMGFTPAAAAGQPVELTLRVFDVDEQGAEDCGPEVDKVSVNGKAVGTLSGANDAWSINTFTLPAGALTSGTNAFQVAIDTGGTGCWAVEVDYAEVRFPFNIAQLSADATDDVDIKRGTSDATIGNRVWATEFDADGGTKAPTPDDPIADAIKNGGRFTYAYEIGSWPQRPEFTPRVEVSYSIEGNCGSSCGTCASSCQPVSKTGWTGSLEVAMPQLTGKYRLTVTFDIYANDKLLRTEERHHDLYVVLASPEGPTRIKSLTFIGTGTPKTAWLDAAFEQFDGGGRANENDVLAGLTAGIYLNPRGWTYGYRRVGSIGTETDDAVALIEGRGTHGECFDFRDVLRVLAASLGIDTGRENYEPGRPFLTTTRPALDGNANANAAPRGGAARDRWFFITHGWVTHAGKRYDPSFGLIGANNTTAFESDSVFCKSTEQLPDGTWLCLVPGSATANIAVSPGAFSLPGLFDAWEYGPPSSPLLPQLVALSSAQPAGPITDVGVDRDGNLQYELLRVDVPIEVTTAGRFSVVATLRSQAGTFIASGDVQDRLPRQAPGVDVDLAAGVHTLPVFFDGRAIRDAATSGPYVVDIRVLDANGVAVVTAQHATAGYDWRAFQGLLAVPGAATDALVDADGIPGAEQLRITLPITATAAGAAVVEASLYAGDTALGAAEQELTLTPGTRQVVFDFSGSAIAAAGVDGPYSVRIRTTDAFHSEAVVHSTAAYGAAQFQPPRAYFSGAVTDQGRDTDSDGQFDDLAVTAELAATVPGTYRLYGKLLDPSGAFIATAAIDVTLGATPSAAVLAFDGRSIGRHGADGPYAVVLSLGEGGSELASQTHRTGAYAATSFEAPSARLTGSYADSVVDADGNGIAEALRIRTGVAVAAAGDYKLRGVLLDAQGRFVAEAQTTAQLGAGPATLDLDFDGGTIRSHGVDGPYTLTSVRLVSAAEGEVDGATDALRTQPYGAADFEPSGPLFVEQFSDAGEDTDGDGLFDYLRVDVTVMVRDPDAYSINARLVDSTGQDILWASTPAVALDAGRHVLSLRFDGRYIYGRGADGPYHVRDLSIYASGAPLTLINAYTTGPYQWQQFEPAAVVQGSVRAHGRPVADALVTLNGVDQTRTDAAGTYRLSAPESGTYTISIEADPALAPWRITVNGQLVAEGTSAPVELTVGRPTDVSFTSGGGSFQPVTPVDVVDTEVPGRGFVDVQVGGQAGVPVGEASMVALKVTARSARRSGRHAGRAREAHRLSRLTGHAGEAQRSGRLAGHERKAHRRGPHLIHARDRRGRLVLHAPGDPAPSTPDVLYGSRRPTSGTVIAPIDASGKVRISNLGCCRARVAAAVTGWFPQGAYQPVAGEPIFDGRVGRTPVDVQVGGAGGVPTSGVAAVVVGVTAFDARRSGSLSVHAAGTAPPAEPDLWFTRRGAVTRQVVVPLDANGKVRVSPRGGHVHVQIAVRAWMSTDSITPLSNATLLDTKVRAHETVDVTVAGRGGVPASGAGSIVLNLSALEWRSSRHRGSGSLRVYPAGMSAPRLADLWYGQNRPHTSLALVALGDQDIVRVANDGDRAVHVVLTTSGWFPPP